MRSQDRTTLIRSYEVYISEYGKDSYVIRAKKTSHILGAYNTFERALEVLDEIQRHITKYNETVVIRICNEDFIKQNPVYEMPKE